MSLSMRVGFNSMFILKERHSFRCLSFKYFHKKRHPKVPFSIVFLSEVTASDND